MSEPGFQGDVRKSAIAVVFEKMVDRLLAGGKSLEASSIHQEDIQPTIVVVIVERDTAACSFEEILVLVLAAEGGFCIEPRGLRYIDEVHSDRRSFDGGLRVIRLLATDSATRQGQGKNTFKGQNERGTTESLQETAACRWQNSYLPRLRLC